MSVKRYVNMRIRQKYDTAANWTTNNPTLLAGEIGIESDTRAIKIGNGSTAWTSLAYAVPPVQPPCQNKFDTAANWTTNDPTLLAGELGIESDTLGVKVGDGTTAWTSLAYLIQPSVTPSAGE